MVQGGGGGVGRRVTIGPLIKIHVLDDNIFQCRGYMYLFLAKQPYENGKCHMLIMTLYLICHNETKHTINGEKFCCTWIRQLTRSLREPGGPCTKSMEVSESRMERVKGNGMTHAPGKATRH